jgi:hypothetical protein
VGCPACNRHTTVPRTLDEIFALHPERGCTHLQISEKPLISEES